MVQDSQEIVCTESQEFVCTESQDAALAAANDLQLINMSCPVQCLPASVQTPDVRNLLRCAFLLSSPSCLPALVPVTADNSS